jgi:hypothetical protein
VANVLIEGRLAVDGPGGGAVVQADGDTVRIDFPSIRAAATAWRATKRFDIERALKAAGVDVVVAVRGVRVRRMGRAVKTS